MLSIEREYNWHRGMKCYFTFTHYQAAEPNYLMPLFVFPVEQNQAC